MVKKFYITSAIPYVNAAPHIGHAQEFIYADVVRRYHALLGEDTVYLSGADENALKIFQAAEKAGLSPEKFTDKHNAEFLDVAKKLNVAFDIWQRGSDTDHHFPSSQKLWQLCEKNGDIYKKSYSGLYCVGCETFYAEDELNENGECFEHPGRKLDKVSEENYFFRLSKYQGFIEDLLETGKLKIFPDFRKNEALGFIKKGLEDFSISRSRERARGWGIPVPNDPLQIMYVWFDALNIYQTGLGFGQSDDSLYKKLWPQDVMVIGKGIIRFHAIYWPAILKSAGLELPKQLFVHGYLTVDGQKMSKTLGNVVDPIGMIQKYGTDPVRYYLLKEIPSFSDGDFSERRFKEVYNSDLANGLGNLVARTISMIQKYSDEKVPTINQDPKTHPLISDPEIYNEQKTWKDMNLALNEYRLHDAIDSVWKFIKTIDMYIDQNKPWSLAKNPNESEKLQWVLYGLIDAISQLAWLIQPFLPQTSLQIAEALHIKSLLEKQPIYKNRYPNIKQGLTIDTPKNLFPRIV
jgi:methionyl-tRNA synthetase